jgi:hypothetical protein
MFASRGHAIAVLGLLLLAGSQAAAQDAPSAAILQTAIGDGVREGFGGAVDRILRARIDALGPVHTRGSVSLDIGEVQLALGCVGETPECLTQVAEQLEVEVLLLPNIDLAGSELVLSVARFDRASGQTQRVVRRAGGSEAETQILDTVDSLVRELFGMPAAPEQDAIEIREEPAPRPPPPPREPQIAGPAIVLGIGAATFAGAIACAVMFQNEADAYAIAPETLADVEERQGHRRTAQDLAIAANTLFVVGGAVVAAGAAWMIVELVSAGSGETRGANVTPLLGPDLAGLSVTGRLPEIR